MRKCIISAVGAATRPKKRRSAEIDPEMALRDAGNGTEGEEGWGGVNVEGCRKWRWGRRGVWPHVGVWTEKGALAEEG